MFTFLKILWMNKSNNQIGHSFMDIVLDVNDQLTRFFGRARIFFFFFFSSKKSPELANLLLFFMLRRLQIKFNFFIITLT